MRKLKNEELDRLTTEEYKRSVKIPVVVVLDNVRSLNNIGSVFRTCDAFRIRQVYLCGITACPPHREIRKTALGATETVAWTYFEKTSEAVHSLRKSGYTIVAVEQADESTPLESWDVASGNACAIVFGHEVYGVGEEIVGMSDICVEIPQAGTKHSLNISVSAGIVLWEVFKAFRQNLG
ncbi:MAG: RNA methyltransferase [Bacteroidales bacterium]